MADLNSMLASLRADVDSTTAGQRTEENLRFADRDKRTDKAREFLCELLVSTTKRDSALLKGY
ncbi:hypothetical protein EM20IM_06250 [Candidatus Methylacidiphilum infernorum]|uniref:Uncharacterized protein n=1 Tax=Candidatus Methylacidiphilum infernorum TaxID=511746 RepID=A0ABX7PU51_9BACT|nr:hypothetical protein [Candidatus Methylacidiphilum infernorum]QSR86111.1 hypothetical protein EM20IM_06250 [Candidatus Methylacidiphilum infernorum]